MTDGIYANHSGIHGHASDVLAVAKLLESKLGELEQAVNAQTASWTGNAQVAYRNLQKEWNKNSTDLQLVLKKIADLMGSAADSYSATDKKMAQNFGG
jgi:6 kDa early secretory antigenic target